MRQEVRVILELTLDVDARLSEEQIQDNLKKILKDEEVWYHDIELMKVKIHEIREESEIYQTDGQSQGLAEYIKKYNIDVKRQTKIDFNGD